MLRTTFYQHSMLAVDPQVIGLKRDAFERLLPTFLPQLVSADDFKDFYADGGAGSCCPIVLTGMLLLQHRYDLPDEEVVRRAQRDLGWRYALGLAAGEQPPRVTSLRRFRAKLRALRGDDFIFRCVLKVVAAQQKAPDVALQALDSTNTECRGAVIDTFNLVATAIGRVIKTVARCLGQPASTLADRWKLGRYLARSIKGAAGIDWSDEAARNALLTEEIADADRLPELVQSLDVTFPAEVAQALTLLQQVARQDVEQLPDGSYRIARGTAAGRVISITDPQARHGRKSKSKTITGFKTHVVGTIQSQFVTGIAITDAATPDAAPTQQLLAQAQEAGLGPSEAVADLAYGTGANVRACGEQGVKLRTKMPRLPNTGRLTKRDFTIDLGNDSATCPKGHPATQKVMVKAFDGGDQPVRRFKFDKATCQACPLRESCSTETARGGGRIITLSSFEPEHQEAIAFERSEQGRDVLRSRSAVERLISHLVRMGMRHARFFGMQKVQFQAFMTAAAYNLQRLMTLSLHPS